MKRDREDNPAAESAHAIQFEIMHGLTRERSESYSKMADAAHARLLSSNPQNVNGVDVSVVFNNVALPWMPGASEVTSALWAGSDVAGHPPCTTAVAQAERLRHAPDPPFIRTVQLVANDGATLVFAAGAGAGTISVNVPKALGEQFFPGDVLLVTWAPKSVGDGDSRVASARLCTLDASVFEDAEAWQDAVTSNVVAALKWVSALCAQPPGLPQLTFIQSSRFGDHEGGGGAPADGWTRLLQLPLLLQVKRSLRATLNRDVVEKLERAILSLLATMLSVFKHSQSIMDLPDIHRGLLHGFLASPLFMEGLSDVLTREAEVLGPTPWQNVSESLAMGVELAVAFACEPLAERDVVSGPVCAAIQEGARSALGSLETVLHRISGVWVTYTRKLQEMRKHGQQEAPDSLYKERRVYLMLEALAAEHTFRPVTRWLQQREVAGQDGPGATASGGDTDVSTSSLTPLDRIQQPPTMNHIDALMESTARRNASAEEHPLRGGGGGGSILRAGVVEEQLTVMNRTYTPYLGKDAVRFVEAAAVAAHSELYGPASRAVCRVLQTYALASERLRLIDEERENTSGADDEEAEEEAERRRQEVRDETAAEMASQRVRVLGVRQHGVRPGGFEDYTLAEIRHLAEYGLPVQLHVSPPVAAEAGEELEGEGEKEEGAAEAATAAATALAVKMLEERLAKRHGGSCFAFLLVRFLGKAVVFPLVVTAASCRSAPLSAAEDATETPSVTAYVMRGADVLAQFVETSAAIEDSGLPDAWLLCGDDPCDSGTTEGGALSGSRGAAGVIAGRFAQRPHSSHGRLHPRRRNERGGPRGGRAVTAGGAVSDALAQGPQPRLLPEGTPALTYVDLLTRLNKMRVELKEELSAGAQKGTAGRLGGTRGGGSGVLVSSAMSLWLRYFARGTPPLQSGLHSLTANATGIVTGTGALGKEVAGSLLRDATDAAAALTPAQIEALYTLSSGSLAPSGATVAGGGSGGALASSALGTPQYLASLRIVEGSVGSGKTSMLYAAGVVKGKILSAARKEHQSGVHPKLKDATARVRKSLGAVAAASTLEELLPHDTHTNPLEGMAMAVETQLGEFTRLSRGVRYCSTPLLIRCARLGDGEGRTGDMPAATRALLYQQQGQGGPAIPALGGMTELMEAALARSCKAPLAIRLARLLAELRVQGSCLSGRMEKGAGHAALDAGLLPLIMATREIAETAAAATATDAWPSYLASHLWKSVADRHGESGSDGAAAKSSTGEEEGEAEGTDRFSPVVVPFNNGKAMGDSMWAAQRELPSGRLELTPVQMPTNIHLPRLSSDEAAAWHTVFLQKQHDVLPLLMHHVHTSVRRVFRLFLDIVLGVAATAQISRYDLITCSDVELLHSLTLPFLWRWSPPHVLVDDFAGMQDGLLLAVSPANSVTLSLSTEVPLYVERLLYRGPMSILRALRKDLQRTAALATTSLNESMRCPKAEINAALGQMCKGSDSAPFAGLLQPTLDADDEGSERNGRRDEADGAASATPPFPGFSSFSSLELWTHAVPVSAATMADQEAASFLCQSIRKHTRGSGAGVAAHLRRIQVCFPFDREAQEFANDERERRQRPEAAVPSPLCTVRAVSFPFAGVNREPFARQPDVPKEAGHEDDEEECDVLVLCLSSLVPIQSNLHGNAGEKASTGQPANEGRAALWKALLATRAAATTAAHDGNSSSATGATGSTAGGSTLVPPGPTTSGPSAFLERLQWWLWRTMARAREGVIVVCSKEFALHVPMFQYVEKYVVQLRRLLSPSKILSYWLPRTTACTVLAFNCPDHFRCRHTAAIAYTEETTTGQAAKSACEVVVRGAASCDSLCLKTFDHCVARAHACLHPCHIAVTAAEEAGGRDGTHDHCPYPCGKRLPCGHVCNKECGSDCDPCTFVGLTELTCGQRVVCGTNTADKSIQYELVHHFQEAKCGAPVRLCTELVSARCPRCGTKSHVPCFQLAAHENRELEAQRDAKQQNASVSGGGTDAEDGEGDDDGAAALANVPFILADGECPGCVAVYNRVAAKFGFDAVPEPTVVQRICAELPPRAARDGGGDDGGVEESDERLCAVRERANLPRHQLSPEAQAELRKAFAVAGKRSELLLMKEALEVSNGSASDKSDFVAFKRQYDVYKATQQRQIQERQDDIRAQMVAWAERLRSEFTKQSELTANLEAMMPSLLSDAQEEARRQRRYGF